MVASRFASRQIGDRNHGAAERVKLRRNLGGSRRNGPRLARDWDAPNCDECARRRKRRFCRCNQRPVNVDWCRCRRNHRPFNRDQRSFNASVPMHNVDERQFKEDQRAFRVDLRPDRVRNPIYPVGNRAVKHDQRHFRGRKRGVRQH
jgi:hypothetical protein